MSRLWWRVAALWSVVMLVFAAGAVLRRLGGDPVAKQQAVKSSRGVRLKADPTFPVRS